MTSKQVFVRESSGLRKEVGLIDAAMLNIGNMAAGAALFIGISPYVLPGSSLWVASLLGLILVLPQLYMYTYLTNRIPRTGGDYVWVSRTLGGAVGVTFALTLMIESLAFFALTAFFSASAIQTVMQTVGIVNSNSYLVSAATIFNNPLIDYGVAALIFGIIIAFNILKPRYGYGLVSVLGIFSLLAIMIAIGVLAANYGHFLTNSGLSKFLSGEGITLPSTIVSKFSWGDTLFMFPFFALFTYPWMQAGPSVASEFRGNKVAKYNLPVALFLTGGLVTIGFFLMYVGTGFGTANYLLSANGGAYNFWTAAIAMAGNPILEWIIGIGIFVWQIYILAYGVIVFSRYIFAMSFDRVLPEIFSRLNKAGSPVYTHLLDLVITLGFLALPVISSSATALYGATILGMLYFAVVSIAGIVFSIRQNSMKLLLASILSVSVFSYLTYESAVNPDFGFATSSGAPNTITLIFVIGTILISGLVYLASYIKHKRVGLDLNVVYKEIPPE
ncbi:amino acid permease [Sulfolobales archaeon HS-7]|nr:amino acid permease [Sulfolobales archaeon HS-7]